MDTHPHTGIVDAINLLERLLCLACLEYDTDADNYTRGVGIEYLRRARYHLARRSSEYRDYLAS